MGDIIEHLDKQSGLQLLRDAVQKARKAVIVSTPKFETDQPDLCANELERHRSLWSAKDFAKFKRVIVKTIDRSILLAVLVKPELPFPLASRRGLQKPEPRAGCAGRRPSWRSSFRSTIALFWSMKNRYEMRFPITTSSVSGKGWRVLGTPGGRQHCDSGIGPLAQERRQMDRFHLCFLLVAGALFGVFSASAQTV